MITHSIVVKTFHSKSPMSIVEQCEQLCTEGVSVHLTYQAHWRGVSPFKPKGNKQLCFFVLFF